MPRQLNKSYNELVKDAQHLFWVKGYKSVKNESLAEHLGVSVSTIYNKYSKEMLYLDALNDYVINLSDPVLKELREAHGGINSLREFFYGLIDAMLNKTFPKSCLIVNTVVEMRNEKQRVSDFYDRYFDNMMKSYRMVLDSAIELGEIKHPEKKEAYVEFLLGVIFSLSVLYKVKPREELRAYIDDQLSFIV